MKFLIVSCLSVLGFVYSNSIHAQSAFLEIAGEIPIPQKIEELNEYEYDGSVAIDACLRVQPIKFLSLALGYKLDGFNVNSEDGLISLAIDKVNVHTPYVGLGIQIPLARVFFIEPQISTGYAFTEYKSENFSQIADDFNSEALSFTPQIQFGVKFKDKLRVFGKIKQTSLFSKDEEGNFSSDAESTYTNIGIGISLGIF